FPRSQACDQSVLSSPHQKPLGTGIKHPAQPLPEGLSAVWTKRATLKSCSLIPTAFPMSRSCAWAKPGLFDQ
ncbi:unnamed protein product, partial [Bubo scandiacus]